MHLAFQLDNPRQAQALVLLKSLETEELSLIEIVDHSCVHQAWAPLEAGEPGKPEG